jgi:hypothetical protein
VTAWASRDVLDGVDRRREVRNDRVATASGCSSHGRCAAPSISRNVASGIADTSRRECAGGSPWSSDAAMTSVGWESSRSEPLRSTVDNISQWRA